MGIGFNTEAQKKKAIECARKCNDNSSNKQPNYDGIVKHWELFCEHNNISSRVTYNTIGYIFTVDDDLLAETSCIKLSTLVGESKEEQDYIDRTRVRLEINSSIHREMFLSFYEYLIDSFDK